MEFTKTTVAALELPAGKSDLIHFDDALPGFGIRLRAGGKRVLDRSGTVPTGGSVAKPSAMRVGSNAPRPRGPRRIISSCRFCSGGSCSRIRREPRRALLSCSGRWQDRWAGQLRS